MQVDKSDVEWLASFLSTWMIAFLPYIIRKKPSKRHRRTKRNR